MRTILEDGRVDDQLVFDTVRRAWVISRPSNR
jgi:hypothetical protein